MSDTRPFLLLSPQSGLGTGRVPEFQLRALHSMLICRLGSYGQLRVLLSHLLHGVYKCSKPSMHSLGVDTAVKDIFVLGLPTWGMFQALRWRLEGVREACVSEHVLWDKL